MLEIMYNNPLWTTVWLIVIVGGLQGLFKIY